MPGTLVNQVGGYLKQPVVFIDAQLGHSIQIFTDYKIKRLSISDDAGKINGSVSVCPYPAHGLNHGLAEGPAIISMGYTTKLISKLISAAMKLFMYIRNFSTYSFNFGSVADSRSFRPYQ
jgi:hypothetical protein